MHHNIVTILILIDGFLQFVYALSLLLKIKVTILILIDGFLQYKVIYSDKKCLMNVTILILIDGFLQLEFNTLINWSEDGHNPYFNRWFSAIQ